MAQPLASEGSDFLGLVAKALRQGVIGVEGLVRREVEHEERHRAGLDQALYVVLPLPQCGKPRGAVVTGIAHRQEASHGKPTRAFSWRPARAHRRLGESRVTSLPTRAPAGAISDAPQGSAICTDPRGL